MKNTKIKFLQIIISYIILAYSYSIVIENKLNHIISSKSIDDFLDDAPVIVNNSVNSNKFGDSSRFLQSKSQLDPDSIAKDLSDLFDDGKSSPNSNNKKTSEETYRKEHTNDGVVITYGRVTCNVLTSTYASYYDPDVIRQSTK